MQAINFALGWIIRLMVRPCPLACWAEGGLRNGREEVEGEEGQQRAGDRLFKGIGRFMVTKGT